MAASSTARSPSTSAPPKASRSSGGDGWRPLDLLVLVPSLVAASTILRSLPLTASAAAGDDKPALPPPAQAQAPAAPASPPPLEAEELALSRVYDARRRVWEKLMAAQVVYLGEAELMPDRDDRVLELEIVRKLAAGCPEAGRSISLALEAFPCDLQELAGEEGRPVRKTREAG